MIVSFLGILINPYGLGLVVFNLRHALDRTMGMVITDRDCLDAGTDLGILVLLLAVAAFDLSKGYGRFIACVFIFMSLMSVRHAVYLFPLLILGIASHRFSHEISFNSKYVSLCLSGVLVLALSLFNPTRYNLDVMAAEIEWLLLEVPEDDGLFVSAVDVIHLGRKRTCYMGV